MVSKEQLEAWQQKETVLYCPHASHYVSRVGRVFLAGLKKGEEGGRLLGGLEEIRSLANFIEASVPEISEVSMNIIWKTVHDFERKVEELFKEEKWDNL